MSLLGLPVREHEVRSLYTFHHFSFFDNFFNIFDTGSCICHFLLHQEHL